MQAAMVHIMENAISQDRVTPVRSDWAIAVKRRESRPIKHVGGRGGSEIYCYFIGNLHMGMII
jgi:hypothetical protein